MKYVKRNFAKNRTFHNLEKLNEDCLAWLERTGNGKVHNTTKKIPAEVFVLEKQHLIPVPHKINISTTKIITRIIRKDNTITYQGNRYALPLGSYAPDKYVDIKEEENMLVIIDSDTNKVIIRYPLSNEKGRLFKSSECRREKDKGIDAYLKEVAKLLNESQDAYHFLELVRQDKPRYIRDQLKIIKDNCTDKTWQVNEQSLHFCLKHKLYSATDLVDAMNYFTGQNIKGLSEQELSSQIKPLDELDRSVLKTQVEIRDIAVYIKELKGANQCQENLKS